MSDEILQQILGQLQNINIEIGGMKAEMSDMKAEIGGMKAEMAGMKAEQQITNKRLDKIESSVALIPFIQQAVMETNGIVKQLESTSKSTTTELRNHGYSIDILNRRQLMLETEVEKLKNR